MTIKARLLPLFPTSFSLPFSLLLPLLCAAALTIFVSGCTQTY